MSEGELLQIEKRRLDITEDIYYEIIRKKTATLISACCALGAQSVNDELQVENMRKFGELIGMAFQIKDDLFDYTDEAIGKPTGIDIKEQKMTLPLIHVLNTCTAKRKIVVDQPLKKTTIKIKKSQRSIAFVKDNNGLLYAETKNG
jgi:octaprenyl-diphosphate synthase